MLGFPTGWKNAIYIYIYITFSDDILIRNEHVISKEHQSKRPLSWSWSELEAFMLGGNPIIEVMAQSMPDTWLFYFWLPFQLLGLITHSTCKIISNILLYFHFWSKCQW